MYAKFVVAFFAVGVVSGGRLLEAASIAYSGSAVVTKTTAPAVSSYSSYSTHHFNGTPIASYNVAPTAVMSAITAPAVAAYAAAPALSAYVVPVTSSFSHSTAVAQANPMTTYTLSPIVAKADPTDFVNEPIPSHPTIKAKTITAPAVSSVSSYSTYTEPVAADSTVPNIAETYVSKSINAPAIATYAAAPAVSYSESASILKSAVAYSAVPAVSVYSGHVAS